MPRGGIKPEKVAGIVALSYLVIIPVVGAWGYLKLRALDKDVETLWDNAEIDPKLAAVTPIEKMRDVLKESR